MHIEVPPYTYLGTKQLHYLSGEKTGIYIADSPHLPMCHNQRINRNKTFDDLAAHGRTTMGCFMAKLHVIINNKGEIIAIKITAGNVDDRTVLEAMTKELKGKLFADKSYISRKLFENIWKRGLHLITSIRKNMKSYLMLMMEKSLLRRRFVVELSNPDLDWFIPFIGHPTIVHILSCIAAYQIRPKKPKINLKT